METSGDRLKAARVARGYRTTKEAAEALGIPVTTYQQHETPTRQLPARRARQYADHFRVDPEWLLYGRRNKRPTSVQVVGRVRGGAEAHLAETEDVFTPVPGGANETTRALVIETGDLGAVLKGWTVLFDQTDRPPTPEMDGRLVVACVIEGNVNRLYVRKLSFQNVMDGGHHLFAVNADPILNARVLWAAPVAQLIP